MVPCPHSRGQPVRDEIRISVVIHWRWKFAPFSVEAKVIAFLLDGYVEVSERHRPASLSVPGERYVAIAHAVY
jgi:hypothetical protein